MKTKTRPNSAVSPAKAIQTTYKGWRMRSRLEARWAVVFDAMKLKWVYEPEGFVLSDGPYLPDFYIESWKLWVEVKPKFTGEVADKSLKFAKEKAAILLLCGTPGPPKDYNAWVLCHNHTGKDEILCVEFGIPHEESAILLGDWHMAGRYYTTAAKTEPLRITFPPSLSEELLRDAMQSGRGARFEHGERGGDQ